MTINDSNKFSIKTYYNNIKMRSVLETKFSYFFDKLNIKYEYEPKSFTLSDGNTIIPDFYLSELNLWFEVKGDMEGSNEKIWELFAKEQKTNVLLTNGRKSKYFYHCFDRDGVNYEETVLTCDHIFVGKCSECGNFFFVPSDGYYACLKCGGWDGDHDIIADLGIHGTSYGGIFVDFYKKDSVDDYIKFLLNGGWRSDKW